jgi:hypothetical protein
MSSLSLMSPLPDQQRRISELTAALEAAGQRGDRLETELRAERRKNASIEKGVAELRTILSPLYQALGMVFGQIETMGVPTSSGSTAASTDSRITAVWESWKDRLGQGPAKVIDALLLHREMNTQQLAIATGYHRTTIPEFIYKLNKAGLINKNSGKFSLKEL